MHFTLKWNLYVCLLFTAVTSLCTCVYTVGLALTQPAPFLSRGPSNYITQHLMVLLIYTHVQCILYTVHVCVLYIHVGVHACKHANSYCIYACMYKFLIHMECDSRMLTFCKCFIHLVPYCLNCFIQRQICQLLTQCSVFNKTLMLNCHILTYWTHYTLSVHLLSIVLRHPSGLGDVLHSTGGPRW